MHGLAAAYYLGKQHGIRKVALLDKSYLGAGASGRNTAILRSNYRTPEGIPFYDASLKLYEQLSRELGWNVLFSQCGHLTSGAQRLLRHRPARARGEQPVAGRRQPDHLSGRDRKLVPALNLSRVDALSGSRGALPSARRHHPARRRGLGLCAGLRSHGHRDSSLYRSYRHHVENRQGNAGRPPIAAQIAAGAVLNATAGWATTISKMAGVPLPIVTHPLQACVTEPLKPFLNTVIVSATLHVYVSQTDKGELVIGAEIDPYQSYSMKGTLPTLEQMATYTLELFPQLHGVRVLRQWAGICDMTPDFAPIIGASQRSRQFLYGRGMGNLRLQGRSHLRKMHGGVDRDRQSARV